MAERPPRTPRAWWKVLPRWLVGCITDPHRHTTSSARLISFAMTYSLHVYLTRTPPPDWRVASVLVVGGIVPLLVRNKSAPAPLTPPATPEPS